MSRKPNYSRKLLFIVSLFSIIGALTVLQARAQIDEKFASPKTELAGSSDCRTLSDKYVFLHDVVLDEFIRKINNYGKCGYRVAEAARHLLKINMIEDFMRFYAILERAAPAQYEYAWFFAQSPGEAQRLANKLAAENLYFRLKFSFMSRVEYEESSASNDSPMEKLLKSLGISEGVHRGAFFLFERKVGASIKKEYRILDGRVVGKRGEMDETNKALNDYAARGFRPLDVWYTGFGIQNLVIVEKDEAIKPEGEYLMLYDTLGLNKKLTELGRQGFEPISIGYVFALLKRIKKEPTGEIYDSIETWGEIEKRLPKWKESGVRYIDTGVADYYSDPFDGRWLMAIPEKNNPEYGKNKDLVFVRYKPIAEEYYKAHDLKPSKKNPLTAEQYQEIQDIFAKEINRLAGEGYRLANMGYPDSLVAMFVR